MKFTSLAYRVPRKDIDTDLIIPAKYLKVTDKAGLKEGCFANLKVEPDFALNRPHLAGSRILVAGANFGCGSSREHAVWAIKQSGIDVIISSDFADIFTANAGKNNLLLITLSPDQTKELMQQDDNVEISVDLEKQVVTADNKIYSFKIDNFLKKKLLSGMGDLDYIEQFLPEIKARLN